MRWCLVLLLPIALTASGQVPPCTLLDSVLAVAGRASYYADALQEQAVDSIRHRCHGATDARDLAGAFTALINALGDQHGRVMVDGQVVAWLTDDARAHRHDDRRPDMGFWNEVSSGRIGADARLLAPRTGYLRIPGLNGGDPLQQAAHLRGQLDSLALQGADRWIIDLRINSGGNMWPMLEGLAPLFPEGAAAGALDRSGARFATYAFREGHFERNGYRAVALAPGTDHRQDRVCVLFGRYTASSGEAVAACFRERPRTLSLGEATAGYTTETGWTTIDRVTLMISESVLCTTDGRPYTAHVAPDEHIEQARPGFDASDSAIARALHWLGE